MKRIVGAANSWCKRKMTKEQITSDMLKQLSVYETAFYDYIEQQAYDWSTIRYSTMGSDLVEC